MNDTYYIVCGVLLCLFILSIVMIHIIRDAWDDTSWWYDLALLSMFGLLAIPFLLEALK